MSPRRHLDDLFSAAYEDELSPIDEARFRAHMQSCAPCAAAYAEFRATIEALHEMPRARMPHVVHLPSTPPVAERVSRPRIGLSWFNLGLVRRFPATAIAGAAAVVLVVFALTHNGVSPQNSTAGRSASSVPAAAPATGPLPRAPRSPTSPLPRCHPASPRRLWRPIRRSRHCIWCSPHRHSSSSRAGRRSSTRSCRCRSRRSLARVPRPRRRRPERCCPACRLGSAARANASPRARPASRRSTSLGPQARPHPPAWASRSVQELARCSPSRSPPSAPGTEIHVTATIPAGDVSAGSPPLAAELTLTTC